MPMIGAHMSISGGLYKAILRGDALGCQLVEIYTQPNRSWKIPPLSAREIEMFREAQRNAKHIKLIIAHNSKLVNLSHPRAETRRKAVKYFTTVLERCEELNIRFVVTSLGSHLGAGIRPGIQAVIKSLNEALKQTEGHQTEIVIENSSGQGDSVGYNFEQIEEILNHLSQPERVSVCFDPQHAFAAGYDLRSQESYEKTIRQLTNSIPLERIHVIHLKDAHENMGSKSPTVEHIGEGFIGEEAFRYLLNDPRFNAIPMCLETEPGEDNKGVAKDLNTLKALIRD